MAPTLTNPVPTKPTKLVCFSFAAYAKTLIDHLRSLHVPILPGLTDQEFSLIESTFHFTFPPDLRSILREGLPVGPHFPNWRSSSPQQLRILLDLPFLNLLKNVSKNGFWVDSWGARPTDRDKTMKLAKRVVGDNGDGTYDVPVLVPILWNCYVPATCPSVSGNPVFHVDDKGVRVIGNDLTTFFHEVDRWLGVNSACNGEGINVPAWAATEPRRVEFWTEVAERGRRAEVAVAVESPRGGDGAWWCREEEEFRGLSVCLERVYSTLREGGWGEDEVRELMMMDGCDRLLHGGDMSAVYDASDPDDDDTCDVDDEDEFFDGGKWSFLEFQPLKGCDPVIMRRRSNLEHLMSLQPVS